jgi:uncharacterized protein (UPF0333 family)
MVLLLIIITICFLGGVMASTHRTKMKANAAFKNYNNKTKDFFK